MLPWGNENAEWQSNPMPQLLYLYLSASVYLVSLTDPNTQFFKVKSVSKSRDHVSNS